jgi:SAM-dependent methyltransferase
VDEVREYYAALGEREWSRLESPSGALEFAVNCHFIERHLPAKSRVLDIGGGPGRYARWLAELGHRVVLADLSEELLAIATDRITSSPFRTNVEEVREADARDLSAWRDGEFDAALSLGPFYHLLDPKDRARAAAELHRVIRPGGIVFVAVMPWYVFLRRTAAVPAERRHLRDTEFLEALTRHRSFFNDEPGRFNSGSGVVPKEVAGFFQGHGFQTVSLIASEGLGSGIEESLSQLAADDPVAHETLMQLIFESADDPSLHGLTTHLMYIGVRQ